MNSNLIYVLIDPRTGEFRYIGMTTKGLVRPKEHLRLASSGKEGYTYNWIRQLQKLEMECEIAVLEECAMPNELPTAEIKWISCYRGMGARLTNATDGGDGGMLGYRHTPEARARISENNRGKKISLETKNKMAVAATGRRHTPETRAKLSAMNVGHSSPMKDKKHRLESRVKMSVAHQGFVPWNKGKKFSAESRAKMSAAAKRRYARQKAEAQGG